MPRHILSFFILLCAYKISVPETKLIIQNFFQAVPILIITGIGVFGVAYIFAGITLLFKRVGFFFQIINFGFLGLFWQNRMNMVEGSIWATLYDIFPLTAGMANLRLVLIHQDINQKYILHTNLFELIIYSFICAFLGYLFFQLTERRARKMALLSQY